MREREKKGKRREKLIKLKFDAINYIKYLNT